MHACMCVVGRSVRACGRAVVALVYAVRLPPLVYAGLGNCCFWHNSLDDTWEAGVQFLYEIMSLIKSHRYLIITHLIRLAKTLIIRLVFYHILSFSSSAFTYCCWLEASIEVSSCMRALFLFFFSCLFFIAKGLISSYYTCSDEYLPGLPWCSEFIVLVFVLLDCALSKIC